MTNPILLRNNVQVFGEGTQPLLFAHGFGCDQNMWRFVTPAFAKDYKVVLFDYVGCGKSDVKAYNQQRYCNLNGYAQDVIEICEALALKDVIFVGHSVSSMVGVLASIKAPHLFEAMIMVGPSPRYINEAPDYVGGFERRDIEGLLNMMDQNFVGWANFLAPAIMQNRERPELSDELRESFCSTDPVIARQFAEVTFFSDNRRDLPHVRIPTLIMQCSEDMIAPFDVGAYVDKHLPHSTLRILKATGHCPHMSHPGETIEVMQGFLAEIKEHV